MRGKYYVPYASPYAHYVYPPTYSVNRSSLAEVHINRPFVFKEILLPLLVVKKFPPSLQGSNSNRGFTYQTITATIWTRTSPRATTT